MPYSAIDSFPVNLLSIPIYRITASRLFKNEEGFWEFYAGRPASFCATGLKDVL